MRDEHVSAHRGKGNRLGKAFRCAFPYTIPIFDSCYDRDADSGDGTDCYMLLVQFVF